MKSFFVRLGIAAALLACLPGAVAAADPSYQLIRHFPTVLAVRLPANPNFPVRSLMRANCRWLYRVVKPNGSAIETQKCRLSNEPVLIPEYQGRPPRHRVSYGGGKCIWTSDYWATTEGTDVMASSFRVLVTPRREAFVTSTYPATPLECPQE